MILSVEDDLTEIINQPINILAVEAKENDERERTAQAFAMFQRSIGPGIYHELFRELSLS